MDWIKKHYDQFILAVLAVSLLAFSAMLMISAGNFGSEFAASNIALQNRDKLPPLALGAIDEAKKSLDTPSHWAEGDSRTNEADGKTRKRGQLFVSDRYVIGQDGTPKRPSAESFYKDTLTAKSIPNLWFLDNNLNLLDPAVPVGDADRDGFLNEDEWRAGTDPNSKDSHPSYVSKLFVKQFIRMPFRLEFKSHDGEPKTPVDQISFGVNTLDLKQPTQFLKLGQPVAGTPFKLEKFVFKSRHNLKTDSDEDVSELTLLNTQTQDSVVLVLNRLTDSPNYSMKFIYTWENPAKEFVVRKLGNFALNPNAKELYKLVDSLEGKAVIKSPDGQQIEVLPDPRSKN
jgi:hypothetical protein